MFWCVTVEGAWPATAVCARHANARTYVYPMCILYTRVDAKCAACTQPASTAVRKIEYR